MAQNVDIRLRRSAVPGKVPTVDQLNLGELALNTADGKLYTKKEIDGIQQIVAIGAEARSGLVSTFNNYVYTSDGTLQTAQGPDDFGNTLSYDLSSPRRIQVYLNGVLLHQGVDYTSPDGVSVTFTHAIDSDQVVQISSYNSDAASIDADIILDDGFGVILGTDEETKLFHNGSNTVLKHMAYGDNTFNMMWRDSDRLIMGENGINIIGELTINGNQIVTDSDVLVLIDGTVTKTYVENLNLTAGSIVYDNSTTNLLATNVQAALDELYDEKLDVSALTSSVVFYPTTSPSDLTNYNKLVTSAEDSAYDSVAVAVNTGIIDSDHTFIGQVASEKGVFSGSTGVINIHTVGNIRRNSVDGTGLARFHFEVYKIDSDNNEIFLGESSQTQVVGETADVFEQFFADALIQSTPFGSGDRVGLKFYGSSVSSNTASYDFQFGGSNPVRSNFPVPINVIPHVSSAGELFVDTVNFDGVLSGNDDTVQKALETIDNIIKQDFVPDSDNVHSLGSLSKAWKDVFVGPGSVYVDGTKVLGRDSSGAILLSSDGTLKLSGSNIVFDAPVNLTTDDVNEGSANVYFTHDRARSAFSGGTGILLDSGNGGSISVDTNVIATTNYAESYADLVSDSAANAALLAANNYADGLITTLDSNINNQIISAIIDLESKIDSDVAVAIQHTDSSISTAINNLKGYVDSQDLIILSSAQSYADSAVNSAILTLVDGAPQVLDTLNELAAALGNDSDFIGTVQGWINQKLDKTATTDAVAEGTNNLYFTEERARSSVGGTNGLIYNPVTGQFELDSAYDASFNTVTATQFTGNLIGNASSADYAADADKLDGQDGTYYRINVYDSLGNLLN